MEILEKIKHKFSMWMLDILTAVLKIPVPNMFTGADASLQMSRLVPTFGARHILLVTDKDLIRLNLMQNCVKQLEDVGVKVTIFDNVSPNPTEEQIEDGIQTGRAAGVDGVLGFGGGSPMDTAKLIACGIPNNLSVPEMEGAFKFKKPAIPLFLVPTTAGTGSEVTIAAVVTSTKEKRKYTVADTKMVAVAAALDHKLMMGIPAQITAETGMDVLTHAVEAYISTRATEASRKASRIATQLVFQYLARAYQNGSDEEAREGMAYASYQGGVAINVGVGYVHAFAHQLGGMYHITHGVANAVTLPHVLDFSMDQASKPLAELAELIGLDVKGKSELEQAKMFIDAVKQLSESLNIPTSFEKLKDEDVPQIYTGAQKEAMAFFGVPKYMDREQGEALLRRLIA